MARLYPTRPTAIFFLFIVTALPAVGEGLDPVVVSAGGTAAMVAPEVSLRLGELDTAIAGERKRLIDLGERLGKTSNNDEKTALEQQIKATKERIARLSQSVEQIVIGGIDTTRLSDAPAEKINWRAELESISLPLLASLRDLTAKPRRIESLRTQIDQAEGKLELINTALASIESFQQAQFTDSVKTRIASIAGEWRSRQTEVQQALEVAQLQLAHLSGQKTSGWQILRENLQEFVQGRGLTLVLAAIAGILTWLILRGLLKTYEKALLRIKGRARTTRLRIVEYAFRTLSVLLVTLSIITVFYVRSDVLLMALSLAAIIGMALGLREVIPRYVRETRLLLDIGPVREGERVLVNGIPFKVVALNVYTVLKNPRLAGVLRLPLSALDGMTSRPERDEPWFPTKPGDYVLINDGTLAQVSSQSVDFVQLTVRESPVIYGSSDFIKMGVCNVSTTGFGVPVTFGIDYDHQAIALNEPLQAFRKAVEAAMAEAGYHSHIQDIMVDFKEAGGNSLDYLIYVKVAGTGAPYYFKLGRLVQQACVRVCNERRWTIPFNQMTLHAGSDLQSLTTAKSESI